MPSLKPLKEHVPVDTKGRKDEREQGKKETPPDPLKQRQKNPGPPEGQEKTFCSRASKVGWEVLPCAVVERAKDMVPFPERQALGLEAAYLRSLVEECKVVA